MQTIVGCDYIPQSEAHFVKAKNMQGGGFIMRSHPGVVGVGLFLAVLTVSGGQATGSVVFSQADGTLSWSMTYQSTVGGSVFLSDQASTVFDGHLLTLRAQDPWTGSGHVWGTVQLTPYIDPTTGLPLSPAQGGVAVSHLPQGGSLANMLMSTWRYERGPGSAKVTFAGVSTGYPWDEPINSVVLAAGGIVSIPFDMYVNAGGSYSEAAAYFGQKSLPLRLTVPNPIPEPVTLALLALGGLMVARRRLA